MKKRLFSLLCVLTLLLGAFPSASALEGESQRAADTLASLRVAQGYNGEYHFDQTITRSEAAVLLLRFSGSDVINSDTALNEVKSQGWLPLTVPKDGEISADEFCGALLRLMGYKDIGSGDEGGAVFARRIGLTTQNYEGALTQGDVFQILRDALPFPYANGGAAVQRLAEKGFCSQSAANALDFQGQELTARQVADHYMAAVFQLDTYYTDKAYQGGNSSNGGSGFFISSDGLAVTNYHTIDQAARATVSLVTGEVFEVERVLYYDADADLALLRVSKTSKDQKTTVPFFACLEMSERPDLRRGDLVYTIGVPLSITMTISDGIISAVNHMVDGFSLPCVINTADISHGSSGGVLLNAYGHAVGVTTGAYSSGNNMYISVPLTPILEADWTAEGVTLAEVKREMH